MDISEDVKLGLQLGTLNPNANDEERFYYEIAMLLIEGSDGKKEASVTVVKESDGTISAVSRPREAVMKLPYTWADVVEWSAEACKYGAWAEPDLKDITEPKLIFSASKTKSVYQAMNFLKMRLNSHGDTLTFTEKEGKLYCTTLESEVEGISFTDLVEVSKDEKWLKGNRLTTSTWNEGLWKKFLYFRRF